MKILLAVSLGLVLIALPNQALASCSTSSYIDQFGRQIICTTCCSINPYDGQNVCTTHCGR